MSQAAEEALAALARDLVEEIAAGRAIELAGGSVLDSPALDLADHQRDILELVNFVRPFQRRSPSGTHMEQVRGYQEQRKPGMGLPTPGRANELGAQHGWIPEDDWLKGEQEWKAKGEAAWKKHEWKGAKKPKDLDQIHREIGETSDRLPTSYSGRGAGFRDARYDNADTSLDSARYSIERRGDQAGQIDQNHMARAYHELAKAHQHIVSHIVPHAAPEQYPDLAQHLQRIAGHMQDLDQAMGANPQATRQLLGTGKEVMAHAGEARREEGHAKETARLEAEASAPVYSPGQEVTDTRTGKRGTVVYMYPPHTAEVSEGRTGNRYNIIWHGDRLQTAKMAHGADLRPYVPPPKTGASAVHPNLGGHLLKQPGDSISGHAHAHAPRQFPVPPDQSGQAALQAHQEAQQEAMAVSKAQESALKQQAREAAQEERLQNAALERAGISPPGTYAPLTDSQFAVHTRNVEKALTAAVGAGMATDQAYTLDGNGQVWEPDRSSAHADIIKEYLDKTVNVPSQRAALFMGGLSGAGKSSLLKHHPDINLKDYAVVNPDDFKTELAQRGMVPKVEGLSPMESVTLIHEESVHLANLAAAELQRRGKNLAFDVTMKSAAVTEPRIAALKANGYHVTAVFVDVPVEKSAQRVSKRYRSLLEKYREGTNPLGGRYVPESVIMAGEHEPGVSKARHTFDRLRSQFDRWELYDGSTPGKATLKEKSGAPASPGIPSVEDLIKAGTTKPYVGSTESEARAAEKGMSAGG
jgi:predicted ABC-type ATPase